MLLIKKGSILNGCFFLKTLLAIIPKTFIFLILHLKLKNAFFLLKATIFYFFRHHFIILGLIADAKKIVMLIPFELMHDQLIHFGDYANL